MHELSICQNMITRINDIAGQHCATRVTKVTLRIGPLAGVEPQLLMQAFPLASAGTVADKATLVIESLPVKVFCSVCSMESEASINNLTCRACGENQTYLISGSEMLLADLELATGG